MISQGAQIRISCLMAYIAHATPILHQSRIDFAHNITSDMTSMRRSRFNVQRSKFVVIMGKPLLLKMFQVLCLIIVGLATTVLLIVIFGYVGILSPEQIESLEKLGTGVLNQKPS